MTKKEAYEADDKDEDIDEDENEEDEREDQDDKVQDDYRKARGQWKDNETKVNSEIDKDRPEDMA